MANRNDPCPCGREGKYKKCCLKWHRLGWPSPPNNDLPVEPKPPGPLAFVLNGRPRYWGTEPGNYRQHGFKVYTDEFGRRVEEEIRSWYTVRKRAV